MTSFSISGIDRPAPARRAARKDQTAVNNGLFIGLMTVAALVPLPLASNRPILWSVLAIVLGLMTTAYIAILRLKGGELRMELRDLVLPAIPFAALVLVLLVQLVPFGDWLGWHFEVQTPRGTIALNTLSVAPGMTWLMLLRQLSFGLFLFLMLQTLANETRRPRMLDILLGITIAYGGYALISLQSGDTILGMEKWAYEGSATGTFVNRNSFATFASMGAAIAAVQLASRLVEQSHRHADDGRVIGNASAVVLYGICFMFLFTVVVLTQSRMGLAACLVGSTAGFVITMTKAQGSLRPIILAAGGVGGLLLLLFTAMLAGDDLLSRAVDLDNDTNVRGNLYAQILQLIQLRPLTGWGGGTFEQAFPVVHQLPVNADLIWVRAHNTYLALWTELGVAAGSIVILSVAGAALLIARQFARSKSRMDIAPQAASLAVIVIAAVHSTVDFSLEIAANTILFLAVLAGGLATLWYPVRRS
jgi:Lipid A core - O-antigen ligase and related enzymes